MNSKLVSVRALLGLVGLGCLAGAALCPTLLAAPPKGSNMKVSAKVETPRLIAVRVRHDMCPVCQQLDPNFPSLIRQASGDSVLFVTLDLTNETTQQQSALLVGALSIEHMWTGDLSKLGSVTFIDGKSRRTISSIQTVDTKQILTALRDAANSSRG